MIYGDDVSHVVTEDGIAYLYKAQGLEERRAALAAIAGNTPIGARPTRRAPPACARAAWWRGRRTWESSAPRPSRALLAARSIDDLVRWSGGLYQPPERFR